MDLSASFLRAAGARIPDGVELDGIDILQHAERGAADFKRTLFWRARRGDKTWKAARDGDFKYVYLQPSADAAADEKLFDLASDPREEKDLSASEEGAMASLRKKLAAWEQDVTAHHTGINRRGRLLSILAATAVSFPTISQAEEVSLTVRGQVRTAGEFFGALPRLHHRPRRQRFDYRRLHKIGVSTK